MRGSGFYAALRSAMSYREYKASKSQIDRKFPYQIALPTDQCTGTNYAMHQIYCANLSLAPQRRTVKRDDVTYTVFYFADPQHAKSFQAIFGGQVFNPKEAGRGISWFL
jgi:hypothetical protein